jgi:hypothetical protein
MKITVAKVGFDPQQINRTENMTYSQLLSQAGIPILDGEPIKANDAYVSTNDVVGAEIFKVVVLTKPKGN